jgi:hypothetical protein
MKVGVAQSPVGVLRVNACNDPETTLADPSSSRPFASKEASCYSPAMLEDATPGASEPASVILTLNCGSRAVEASVSEPLRFSSSRDAAPTSHINVGDGSKLTQRVTQVCRGARRSASGHERAFAEPFLAEAGTYRRVGRERLGGSDSSDGESSESCGGLHGDFLMES